MKERWSLEAVDFLLHITDVSEHEGIVFADIEEFFRDVLGLHGE